MILHKQKTCLVILIILSQVVESFAQTPLWQGNGRIVVSADGNEHDHDDWAATPLSLAIIAAKGLQHKLPVYIYSDHIWGSNHEHPGVNGVTPYEQMKESALTGGKMFGFKTTKFICAVDNPEIAYEALKEQVNQSTLNNPLFIIVAGPVQVIGEAVSRADSSKRKFVTIISTTDKWNNTHADEPYTTWENHSGWTIDKIKNKFAPVEGGGIKIVLIQSQNKGLKRNWKEYEWVRNAPEANDPYYRKGSWTWLFNRLCMSTKPMGEDRDYYYAIDASDAGKVIFLLTGNDTATPRFCYEMMKAPTAKRPVPKLKDRTKKGVLTYLKTVIQNNQVIAGQQCSETPDVAANNKKAFQSIFDSTGKYPALLGLDDGYFKDIDMQLTNRFAMDHWKKAVW